MKGCNNCPYLRRAREERALQYLVVLMFAFGGPWMAKVAWMQRDVLFAVFWVLLSFAAWFVLLSKVLIFLRGEGDEKGHNRG